jgi:hypothetical protein
MDIIVHKAIEAHIQRGKFLFPTLILAKKTTIGLPTRANIADISRYVTIVLKYHARKNDNMIPATISIFWYVLVIFQEVV